MTKEKFLAGFAYESTAMQNAAKLAWEEGYKDGQRSLRSGKIDMKGECKLTIVKDPRTEMVKAVFLNGVSVPVSRLTIEREALDRNYHVSLTILVSALDVVAEDHDASPA